MKKLTKKEKQIVKEFQEVLEKHKKLGSLKLATLISPCFPIRKDE